MLDYCGYGHFCSYRGQLNYGICNWCVEYSGHYDNIDCATSQLDLIVLPLGE